MVLAQGSFQQDLKGDDSRLNRTPFCKTER
jgi:hypothetical protein